MVICSRYCGRVKKEPLRSRATPKQEMPTCVHMSPQLIVDSAEPPKLDALKTIKKDNSKNEIIKFEQLNINLENLQPGTITRPKLQETSTFKLIQCMNNSIEEDVGYCKESAKKEIKTVLNRRFVLPFYIPIVSNTDPLKLHSSIYVVPYQ